ncbi:hypothetical protein TNCT_553981 [Trichonephila clavata]|uniref:Uncharacterized protein n=1 Tax=Trichonephila clavata TaxID=2740835 RepID=A0A8X6IZM9_TRICU|nr:hypothetical protein TNCT_590581 [Trichonephila clavata]GFR14190.1 hypothetical protein TNCT_553981 [Trichonephila clavata]
MGKEGKGKGWRCMCAAGRAEKRGWREREGCSSVTSARIGYERLEHFCQTSCPGTCSEGREGKKIESCISWFWQDMPPSDGKRKSEENVPLIAREDVFISSIDITIVHLNKR